MCVLFAVTLGVVTGCSPKSFFGSSEDEKVLHTESYRQINTACAGMDLSTSIIEVPQFRKILNCFNSYGALDPLWKLSERLQDSELQPVVTFLNEQILNNKTMLYELESTYQALEKSGLLKSTLQQFGRLLENEDFVSSAIALLREGTSANPSGASQKWIVDPLLLKAIEHLSVRMKPESISRAMNSLLSFAGASSFQSVQNLLKLKLPVDSKAVPLRTLTDSVLKFAAEKTDPGHVQVGKRVVESLVSGQLFSTVDEWLGADVDSLRHGVPRAASLINLFGKDSAKLLDQTTSLFHYGNRPFVCFRNSTSIENAADHMVRELVRHSSSQASDFLGGENVAVLAAMSGFCEYPRELSKYYSAFIELADSEGALFATDLIRSLHKNGLSRLLIELLADTGSAREDHVEDKEGLKLLLPLVSEFVERNLWTDLLFTSTLLSNADRVDLVDLLTDLIVPRVNLNGRSVYDVLTDSIVRAKPADFYRFILSLKRFVDSEEPLLVPSLTVLRQAYHINDVHPVINLIQSATKTASHREQLYGTLFKMTELPEFAETVKMSSQMAKDGRMQQLLGSVVTLFHKFAIEGKIRNIVVSEASIRIETRRHNLSSQNVKTYVLQDGFSKNTGLDRCSKVDIDFGMTHFDGSNYASNVKQLFACVNRSSGRDDLTDVIEFLSSQSTSRGDSYWSLPFRWMSSISARFSDSSSQATSLIRQILGSVRDGRVDRFLRSIKFFTNSDDSLSIFHQLIKVVRGVWPSSEQIVNNSTLVLRRAATFRLMGVGADLLERPEIPSLLKSAEKAWNSEFKLELPRENQSYDFQKIAHWVHNKECVTDPAAQMKRVQEIIADYQGGVVNHDLGENGQVKRSWTKTEFREAMTPLLKKFSDSGQWAANKSPIQSTLNLLKYFTLKKGEKPNSKQHFTPEYLAHWFYDRSRDYKLISYFYPGEKRRRVKLANTLDRLEMVVINSDFRFKPFTNYSLLFLAEMGNAWGDEPRELWPEAIQRQYPVGSGRRPETLREAYGSLMATQSKFEKLAGYPKIFQCLNREDEGADEEEYFPRRALPFPTPVPFWLKAALYNSRQVLSVIEENLPDAHTPMAGGMRVLRNLFYEMYTSSTSGGMNSNSGDWNNLTTVTRLVRMGMTRQIGHLVRRLDRDDPAMLDAFRAVIQGAATSEIEGVLKNLVIDDPKQDFLWSVLDLIFDITDDVKNGGALAMKQMSFYLLSEAGRTQMTPQIVQVLNAILPGNRQFLNDHVNLMTDVFQSRKTGFVLRAFYEDQSSQLHQDLSAILSDILLKTPVAIDALDLVKAVYSDTEAHSAWNRLTELLDLLVEDHAYQALDVSDIGRDLLHFFEEDPAASALLKESSAILRNGDAGEWLSLMVNHPKECEKIPTTVSRYVQNGDLTELLELIKRSFPK